MLRAQKCDSKIPISFDIIPKRDRYNLSLEKVSFIKYAVHSTASLLLSFGWIFRKKLSSIWIVILILGVIGFFPFQYSDTAITNAIKISIIVIVY